MFINDKFLFFLCVNLLNPESLPTHESVFYERERANGDVKLVPIYGHSKSLKQSSVLKMPF